MGFLDAPCSTVSNFVQNTIVSVFNALQLTPVPGGGAAVGIANFFVRLWNGALALAQQVVQGLINKVSQFVRFQNPPRRRDRRCHCQYRQLPQPLVGEGDRPPKLGSGR